MEVTNLSFPVVSNEIVCSFFQNFDSLIKEKDVELQHLANTLKNLQRAKQDVEDNLNRSLREKDSIISQLQLSLEGKTKDMEVSIKECPLHKLPIVCLTMLFFSQHSDPGSLHANALSLDVFDFLTLVILVCRKWQNQC